MLILYRLHVFSFHSLFTVNASYGERLLDGQMLGSKRSRILRKNAEGESRTTSEIWCIYILSIMRPNEIWGFIWERDLGQGVALFFPEEPILCRCLAFSLTYCGYRIRERPHFIMIDKVKLCSRPRDVSVWYFKPACVYVRRSRLMFTCQQNASERCLLWVSDFFSLFPGDETS